MVLVDFLLFRNLSATPTNRASGAFGGGSSCANSDGSISIIKVTYFEDFGVLGCEYIVILIDFILFCNRWATPTNRASGAFRDGPSCANSGASILLIKLTYLKDFNLLGGAKN